MEVIKLECGWGYDILHRNQVFIHQPNIPVIQETITFRTKHEAKKVGNLVLKKIKSDKFPIITQQELDSLKIQY